MGISAQFKPETCRCLASWWRRMQTDPPSVSVPQAAAGSSGEGLDEELGGGKHGGSAAAARSRLEPRVEEGKVSP